MPRESGDVGVDGYCEDVRYFNTSGPCVPQLHYMLPPEPRLPDARELIDEGLYFVVHAPRQTGKTTTLSALARDLTAEGQYAALRFSCERAKVFPGDVAAAETAILAAIRQETRRQRLPAELLPPDPWPGASPGSILSEGLEAWAVQCPRPLVLFFDEIDALRDETLLSVLAQLRDGFSARPESFPASVVLCGLRDVRDYKAASGGDVSRMGSSSPFNVAVKSLRISDFTRDQVAELYGQHTAETGQEFTPDAVERSFEYTQGQPWLVNAIAREITREMRIEPPWPITAVHVDDAKERLILTRATHLDSLVARLNEPRVRTIVEPLIAGTWHDTSRAEYNDDLAYARDLGLVVEDNPVRVANPIYKEVIVRVLADGYASQVTAEPRTFLLADGRLDFGKLLSEFADWWRRNGEWLAKGEMYHEVAPQLIFMAFLQRVVNGGGIVDREYGIGTGRVDILVRKPYAGANGRPAMQEEGIELKVRTDKSGDPLDEALEQMDGYLSRFGLDHGTLLVFDRRSSAVRNPSAPEFTKIRSPEGRDITLLTA